MKDVIDNIDKAEPCPFCGGEDIRVSPESAMAFHAVCRGCGARSRPFETPSVWPKELPRGTTVGALDEWLMDKARRAWNRRSPQERQKPPG